MASVHHGKKKGRKRKRTKVDISEESKLQTIIKTGKLDTYPETIDSSSEEDISAYQTLLSSLPQQSSGNTKSAESSDDLDEDEEDVGEEESDSHGNIDDNEDPLQLKPEKDENGEDDLEDNDNNVEENGDEAEEENDDEILESGDDEEEFIIKTSDPFSVHFEHDLDEKFVEKLSQFAAWSKSNIKLSHVGKGTLTCVKDASNKRSWSKEKELKKQYVKYKLCQQVFETNQRLCKPEETVTQNSFTPFQQNLFKVINSYQDVYFPNRSESNGEQTRLLYCLHGLNHILKTRSRVIAHNTKLKNKEIGLDADEYRDQGLTRPKVLMVLPFRESALRVVNMMQSLLMPKDERIIGNKKRFQSEYGEEEDVRKAPNKPADYDEIFAGNIDDHFRIGIGIAKNTMKLYTKFYMSDIILASPLGLRTIINTEGDKERDYDFLNSLELLILDQADVFTMQNWDHILHLMNHLHLQPRDSHGVDFSRVRMWTINGWSKYYRQTLVFSSVAMPQLTALFNRQCHNYAGKVTIHQPPTEGTICQIVTQLPQTFHKLPSMSYSESFDARFDYFVKKILPHHKDEVMAGTLIYIPSYFDYVRVRNHFAREDLNFVHINEYSKDKSITKARSEFFHQRATLMLYTERCHFFKRYKIRGIRHLIFYELPTYPHYYSEMCNMLQEVHKGNEAENFTCTVLYTTYDAQRLAGIVGTERASVMVNSNKNIHMFVTGENT